MTNEVLQYMSNATGFLYILNSGSSGGIQEDRVGNYCFSDLTSLYSDRCTLSHYTMDFLIFCLYHRMIGRNCCIFLTAESVS